MVVWITGRRCVLQLARASSFSWHWTYKGTILTPHTGNTITLTLILIVGQKQDWGDSMAHLWQRSKGRSYPPRQCSNETVLRYVVVASSPLTPCTQLRENSQLLKLSFVNCQRILWKLCNACGPARWVTFDLSVHTSLHCRQGKVPCRLSWLMIFMSTAVLKLIWWVMGVACCHVTYFIWSGVSCQFQPVVLSLP